MPEDVGYQEIKVGNDLLRFPATMSDEEIAAAIESEYGGGLPQQVGNQPVDASPVQLPPQQTRRDLGAEKPPFFNPAGPQFERIDNRGFSPQEREMASRGIDVTREIDAPDIRAAMGFSPNEAFSASFVADKMAERTGLPRDEVVRLDKTGAITVFDQGSGRYVPLDSSNMTMNDLRDLYGPAYPIGGSIAGSVAGLMGGGPFALPASIGAGGLMAGFGEYMRLAKGKELGVHDLSAEEMMTSAFKEFSIDVAAGAGGAGVTKLNQLLRNIIKPPGMKPATAEDILNKMQSEGFIDDIDEINKLLANAGSRHKVTIDPVALAQDELGLELRESAARGSRDLGALHTAAIAENTAALDDMGKVLLGLDLNATPFQPGVARSDLGRDVQEALRGEANRIQSEADVNLRLAEIQARRPLAQYGRLDVDKAGSQVANTVSAYGNGLKSVRDEAYTTYSRAIGQPVKGDPGYSEAARLGSSIKIPVDQRFADYAKAQKTIKQASLITPKVTGEDALKVLPQGRQVDLALLDNNIKWLNQQIDRGSGEFSVDRLKAARNVLQDMREDFLFENHPEVLSLLNKAQTAHHAYKDFVNDGVLSSIIKTGPDGVVVTNNARAFHHVWARDNSQALRELMEAAREVPGADAQLKKTALQIYKAEVIPEGSNVPSLALHNKFVKDHRAQMEAVFGPNAKFWQFGKLTKNVERELARAEAVRARLSKSALAKFSSKEPGLAGQEGFNSQGISPELLGRKVLQTGASADDVLEVVRVLETDPALLKSFQESIGRELYQKIMPNGTLSVTAIPRTLQQGDNLQKLTHAFGPQYVSDMQRLWKGLQLNLSTASGPKIEKTTPFGLMLRTMVTPPLTKRGRAQTFVEFMRADAISEALYQAVTDPKVLQALVAQGNKDIRNRRVVSLFSQISALSALHSVDDTELGVEIQNNKENEN